MLAKQVLYTLIHVCSLFCSGYYEDGVLSNYLPELTSNHDLSNLSLPSRDYRHEPLEPG
jgi:hypothetical protein